MGTRVDTRRSVTFRKSWCLNINWTCLVNTYYLPDAANTEPEKLPWAALPAIGSKVHNRHTVRPPGEGWAAGTRSEVGRSLHQVRGDSRVGVGKMEVFGQSRKEKGRLETNVNRSPESQNSTAQPGPAGSSVCSDTRCRGVRGDAAGAVGRGLMGESLGDSTSGRGWDQLPL